MREYIKQFLFLLDPRAKKSIPILIFAFLFSSLLDVIGIGLVGIFLGLLTNPHFFVQKYPNAFFFLKDTTEKEMVIISGLFIVTAFLIKAVITLSIQSKIIFFCHTFSVRLKTRLMTAYQYAPYTFHLQKNSAHLISRVQGNLDGYINGVLMASLNLISNSLITLFILSLLLILHPFSTFFLIILFVLIGLGYDFFARRKLPAMGKIVALGSGKIIHSIHNGLHGLIEVRVLGREDYFIKTLDKISRQYADAAGVVVISQQLPRYLVENAIAIFVVGLSLVGIVSGFDSGSVVAMVGTFAVAGARLLPTVNQIITTINQLRGSYHHMNLVYDELAELDSLKPDSLNNKSISYSEDKLNFSDISLKNTYYQYPHTTHSALTNVNITVSKGQSVGLIGPSGAGKSTLVNVILGFLEPQRGELLADGKPIENLRAWLNNFAYIPQTIFLLDDTLRRNIALGINDEDIDDVRIWNAVKMAQLTEVVHQLPNGLDTLIGENGVRLSGGQRQRVALARAFYHERDVIIMDEATSSLDHETEKEVINTIKRLKGNKTLIVIAHRLTTVEHCDVLYRLEKGQVTAVGSYQEVVGVDIK